MPPQQLPLFTFRMLSPFVFPDPYDMMDLPSDRNLNPSIQQIQRGPEHHVSADKATPFTCAVFPCIVILYKLLVANLDTIIVEQIQQVAPDTYLAVVASTPPATLISPPSSRC